MTQTDNEAQIGDNLRMGPRPSKNYNKGSTMPYPYNLKAYDRIISKRQYTFKMPILEEKIEPGLTP